MFFAVPSLPAFLVDYLCIYNNSVDYLTFPLGGLSNVQDRILAQGDPLMLRYYSNR